ncbi:MAG: hypothetical protein FWF87_00250 [Synergistaceae bacterium]|nr:hypothetical protein [Synergistaceae bacterium]
MKKEIMKKCLLALMLLVLAVSVANAAGPLDTLKSTWERWIDNMTDYERTQAVLGKYTATTVGDVSIWTRMNRVVGAATTTAQYRTTLPAGYPAEGEVLPFVKIVAQNSGGRIRYETIGYSQQGVPIPLLVVGLPKAPKGPEEVGNRIIIRWQCSLHGDEGSPIEAALIFLREAAQGKHDELLKDAVLLVTPGANPDGRNLWQRAFASGDDPNRCWGAAQFPEIRAALKLYRDWDPHVVIDHHCASFKNRHIVSFTSGQWGNNDPDTTDFNFLYAESIYGEGLGKYASPETNFYRNYMAKLVVDYSPGNSAGNLPISLSESTIGNNNTYSPDRNSSLTIVSIPYMDSSLIVGLVSHDVYPQYAASDDAGNGNMRAITKLPNAGSDSIRSTATVPPSRNRIGILTEINGNHHSFLKVNCMYAAFISAVEQAVKQKSEIFAFISAKDSEYRGLNNSSPKENTTVFQGAIDYRPTASSGGNEGSPFRKPVMTDHDMGYGVGKIKVQSYQYSGLTYNAVNRWIDRTWEPILELGNLSQYPVQMGAFYIMDPRASNAANVLMRHGIEVYKLKQDVTLPNNVTYKFCGPGGSPNWHIIKNTTRYASMYTTKVPRPRAELLANDGGVGWTTNPLTTSQIPNTTLAPEEGGGDWFPTSLNHVAKAGHYVIPTAQRFAKLAGFELEPRSNCGLLFWSHWDSAVGGDGRYAPASFDLDLVKTFDYTAIPASALELVILAEDANSKPDDTFTPPFFDFEGLTGLVNDGARVESAVQDSKAETVTVTIKDACLHDGMWLTFFFYDDLKNEPIPILKQVFEGEEPGTYKAVFTFEELKEEGLKYGVPYAVHYSNEGGDITGYGTFTKGVLGFNEAKDGDGDGDGDGDDDDKGCNAGFATLAVSALILFVRKK